MKFPIMSHTVDVFLIYLQVYKVFTYFFENYELKENQILGLNIFDI